MAVCYLFLWLAHKVTVLLVKAETVVDLVVETEVETVAVATVEATEVETVAVATVEALVVETEVATSHTPTHKKPRSTPGLFVFTLIK